LEEFASIRHGSSWATPVETNYINAGIACQIGEPKTIFFLRLDYQRNSGKLEITAVRRQAAIPAKVLNTL
jgi:hypothetical protein